MNRSIRILTGALALVLGACAAPPAPSVAPPVPQDEAGREAAALHARCARDGAQRAQCYDQALLATLRERGINAAMRVLDRLGELDPTVRQGGHMYAHSLGLAAYSSAAEVGRTFRQCEPTFQSGCYHGVIQAHFVDLTRSGRPVGAEEVNAVCADYRGNPDDRWILFQCTHGIGHGVTMLHGHELPRALEACDLIRDAWEREGCYGGAFMESIMQATTPHHAMGRPGAAGEAAGHDHHGMHAGHGAAPEPAFRPLDPDDPLYPCTVLAERYLFSCYQMQTSVVLARNQGDYAATARVCDQVREGVLRAACYGSLGRDISGRTVQNGAEAARLCEVGDPAYRGWCHAGFVKNVIDTQAHTRDALAYCRALPAEETKRACYTAVGEEVWVLAGDRARREAHCAGAEPEFRETCRGAAGLLRASTPAAGRS